MKKAFTLIELLVVIAIIAVLTGIVMASFTQAKSKSRDAERISELAQIQLAIQLYFDRCGQYPRAEATNGPTGKINISSNTGCPAGISLATFMSQLPTPPANPTGSEYAYRYAVRVVSGVANDYYLGVRLENANAALSDDVDGTVGNSTGWTGYNTTSSSNPGGWDADDTNNIYTLGSK